MSTPVSPFGELPLPEDPARHEAAWAHVLRDHPPDGSTAAWEARGREQGATWASAQVAEGDVVPVGDAVTRVVVAGDWHGNAAWASRVLAAAAAARAPVVAQLGDFGVWPGRHGQAYLDAVSRLAQWHDVVVVFLDGNHEDFAQLARTSPLEGPGWRVLRPHVVHAPRGQRWAWAGLSFAAFGGATSLDRPRRTPGSSWWPQEEITRTDLDALGGGAVDVLLTHDVPSELDVPGLSPAGFPPEEVDRAQRHRRWIDEALARTGARRLLHGHLHVYHHGAVWVAGTVRLTLGLAADGGRGVHGDSIAGSAALLDLATLRLGEPARS